MGNVVFVVAAVVDDDCGGGDLVLIDMEYIEWRRQIYI